MLTLSKTLLEHTDYKPLLDHKRGYADDFTLKSTALTDEMLEAVRSAANLGGERGVERAVDAMISARAGDVGGPIPRLMAFPDMAKSYLMANLIDGWVYIKASDGHMRPWLVTDVVYRDGTSKDDKPSVSIHMVADGSMSRGGRGSSDGGLLGMQTTSKTFYGRDVAKKTVSAALEKAGLYVETPALKATYEEELAVYSEVLSTGFSEQYRYSGRPGSDEYWTTPNPRHGVKVIHDIRTNEIAPPTEQHESALVVDPDDKEGKGMAEVPVHFNLRVFDLSTHEYLWVHTSDVKRYVYDKTLREKIILPEDQRNLLDILTSDLDEFTGDIIEGKSAGNVVMCKGEPGVGKTLTAEVYSELIERPLYSIHSGSLGITAESVRKNLEVVFERSTRWNAVLLLDEADVFVLERGMDLSQNAIVAEFLRTLEYFTGLMFMTTNRANNIDDAILSRAAAIIDYKVPDKAGIREVWKVQAANQKVEIPEDLLDEIVGGFVHIAPRDVKMLLRLALRVAKGGNHDLDIDTIAKCAMFRGLHFSLGSRTS